MPSTSLYRLHARLITLSSLALVVTACADTGGGVTGAATMGSTSASSSSDATDATNATSSITSSSTVAPTSFDASSGVDASSGGSGTTASGTTGGTTTAGETSDPDTGGDASGVCQEACASDSDCFIKGVDQDFVCKDSRCVPPAPPGMCTSDLYCKAGILGQFTFCTSSEECGSGWCIDVENGAQGLCAPPPNAKNVCPYPQFSEVIEAPTIDGETKLVCVAEYTYCGALAGMELTHGCGLLPEPCKSDTDCNVNPTMPVCAGDGSCICTEDAQCTGAGLPTCVVGRCACTSDADCADLGVGGIDACIDGACGCSSVAVCPKATQYDGTQPVCEPL